MFEKLEAFWQSDECLIQEFADTYGRTKAEAIANCETYMATAIDLVAWIDTHPNASETEYFDWLSNRPGWMWKKGYKPWRNTWHDKFLANVRKKNADAIRCIPEALKRLGNK